MKDNKMMSNNFRNTFNENQIYVRWSTGMEPFHWTTDCRINRIDDVVAFIYCFSMNRNDGD